MAGGKSDYLEAAQLNEALGGTAFGAPATVYVALYSASPTDAGGGTELSGGAYARASVTNNTTNWPAGNPKSNGTTISYSQATADWSRAYSWGIFDALSSGNLLYWGPLCGTVRTAVVNDVTNDTFFAPSHGYANDTIVRVFTHPQNALPSPLALDTRYYVANTATDTFKLSTAAGGGSIVNLTALGFVEVAPDQSIVVTSGGTASFAASALSITED